MELGILKFVTYCWSAENLEDEMVLSVNSSVGVPFSQGCEVTAGYDIQRCPRNLKYECE